MPLAAIGTTLAPVIEAWAAWRTSGEGFGDFTARLGPEAIRGLLNPSAAA